MLPNISVTAQEGSARPIGSGETKALVIGPSSAGVKTSKIYTFANINTISSQLGYGPAQQAAELMLNGAPAGFGSVDVVVAPADPGLITQYITGAVGQEISLTSITADGPSFTSDVQIEITRAGAVGTARFRYTLDGGYSWASDLTTSSSFVIPSTNMSCSFTGVGAYAVGTKNTSYVTGPTMTEAGFEGCVNALSQSRTNYTYILVADDQVDPAKNLFDKSNSLLTGLNDFYNKHTQMVVPCGGESRVLNEVDNDHKPTPYSDVLAEVGNKVATVGNFIQLVAERARTIVPIARPGYSAPVLPFAFSVAAQDHFVGLDISKNPAVDFLSPVLTVSYDDFLDGTVYHDEKITAPRSFMGLPGWYVNQALLKSASNSTWDIIPKARITSRARGLLRAALFRYLNHRIAVIPDGSGRIDPSEKIRIEAEVTKVLSAVLLQGTNGDGSKGHCTALEFTINGENNLLLTSELEGQLNIVPFAYPTSINVIITLSDTVTVTGA